MPVVRDTAIPLADYQSGTEPIAERVTPNWLRTIRVEIRRCTSADLTIWPNEATTLEINLEVSFDNGQTWQSAGGFGAPGGIHVTRFGVEAPLSVFTVEIPAGATRLRGTRTIVNGPLRTEGVIEVSDAVNARRVR